jgi:hypothetical protein
VKEHQESDGEAGWEKLKARIDDGHPVAALADTFHLETYYYPGLGHHSDHYVILDGYDEEAETVHIVDASWIVRFRGDLPLSGFKAAWGAKAIPSHRWMEFHLSEPRWTVTPEQAAWTIRRNIGWMLHGTAQWPGTFAGLPGLKVFVEELSRWPALEPYLARACLKRLFDQLRNVVIEREGHSRYLKRVADTLGRPGLADAGERLRLISQKWLVFRNLHLRLLEIASLEENALAELQIAMEA